MKPLLAVRMGDVYAGLARGRGRWYKAVTQDLTHYGYVWTDDAEKLGSISTRTGPQVNAAEDIFKENKRQWASSGLSASAAFDESIAVQDGAFGVETTVEEGDLFQDLIIKITERELKTMARTKIYSVTLDFEDNIMELLRSSEDGLFYRENGAWHPISPEASSDDYPTIFGLRWVDVLPEAVAFYDSKEEEELTKEDMGTYLRVM